MPKAPKTSIEKDRNRGSVFYKLRASQEMNSKRTNSIKNFIKEKYKPKGLNLVYKIKDQSALDLETSGVRESIKEQHHPRAQSMKNHSQPVHKMKNLAELKGVMMDRNNHSRRRVQSSQNNRGPGLLSKQRPKLTKSQVANAIEMDSKKKRLTGGSPDLASSMFESHPANKIKRVEDSLVLHESPQLNNLILKLSKKLKKMEQPQGLDHMLISPVMRPKNKNVNSNFLFSTHKDLYNNMMPDSPEKKEPDAFKKTKNEINNSLLLIGNNLTSILTSINKGKTTQECQESVADSKHDERMDKLDLIIDELESKRSIANDGLINPVKRPSLFKRYAENSRKSRASEENNAKLLPPLRAIVSVPHTSLDEQKNDNQEPEGKGKYEKNWNLASMKVLNKGVHFETMPENRSLSQRNHVSVGAAKSKMVQYSMWDPKRSNSRIIHKTRQYMYEFLDMTKKKKELPVIEAKKEEPKKKAKKKKVPKKDKDKKLVLKKKFFLTNQPKTKKKKKKPKSKKKPKTKKNPKNRIVRKTKKVTKYVGPKNGPKVKKSIIITTYETKKKPKSKVNTGLKKKKKQEDVDDDYVTTVRTSIILGNSSVASFSKQKKLEGSSSLLRSSINEKHESMFFPPNYLDTAGESYDQRKIRTSTNFFRPNEGRKRGLSGRGSKLYRGSEVFGKKERKSSFKKNQSLVFKISNSESDSQYLVLNPFLRDTHLKKDKLLKSEELEKGVDVFPITEETSKSKNLVIEEEDSKQKNEEKGNFENKSERIIENRKKTRTPTKKKMSVQSLYKKKTPNKQKKRKKMLTKSEIRREAYKTMDDIKPLQTSIEKLLNNRVDFKKKMHSTICEESQNPLNQKMPLLSTKTLNKQRKKKKPKKKKLSSTNFRKAKTPMIDRPKAKQTKYASSKRELLAKKKKKVKKESKITNKDKGKGMKPKMSTCESLRVSALDTSISKTKGNKSTKANKQRPYKKHSLIWESKSKNPKKSTSRIRTSFKSKDSFFSGKDSEPTDPKRRSTEFTFDEFQQLIKRPSKIKPRVPSKKKRKFPKLEIKIENEQANPDTESADTQKKEETTFEDMETPKASSTRKDASSGDVDESLIIRSQKMDDFSQIHLDSRLKDYVFDSQGLQVFRDPRMSQAKHLPQGLCFLKDISDFTKKVIEDNLNLINHFEHYDKSITSFLFMDHL